MSRCVRRVSLRYAMSRYVAPQFQQPGDKQQAPQGAAAFLSANEESASNM